MTYGYIRVSTRDQNEDRQLDALRGLGIPRSLPLSRQAVRQRLSTPPVSAAASPSPLWRCALSCQHRPSWTQLRRNSNPVARTHQRKRRRHRGVGYAPVGHPTGQRSDGDLYRRPCPTDFILRGPERAREHPQTSGRGIAAAKARGVCFGRPPKPLPSNFATVCRQWQQGRLTMTQAAKDCHLPLSTFREKAIKWCKNQNDTAT